MIRRCSISMLAAGKTAPRDRIVWLQWQSHCASAVEMLKCRAGLDQSKNNILFKCVRCRVIVVEAPDKKVGKTASHLYQIERCLTVEFVHTNAYAYILSRAVPGLKPAVRGLSSDTAQKISKLIGRSVRLKLKDVPIPISLTLRELRCLF